MKNLLFLIIFISSSAYAKKGYRIPELNDVIIPYGSARINQVPNKFTLLSWNIFKGGRENFSEDYQSLIADSDLVTLQEFFTIDSLVDLISNDPDFKYIFATSFLYTNQMTRTGVISGSSVTPIKSKFIRTTNREPIANTPKMSLISIFAIENCTEKLMLVNTHAINFVLNGKFNYDIEKIVRNIKYHKGPLIWAGDFNTWNPGRITKLGNVAKRLGLAFAKLKNSKYVKKFAGYPLDHILYRGVTLASGEVLKDINSSDHKPLKANFEYSCSNQLAQTN